METNKMFLSSLWIFCFFIKLVFTNNSPERDDLLFLKEELVHLKKEMDVLKMNVSDLEMRNIKLAEDLKTEKNNMSYVAAAIKNDMQHLNQVLREAIERNISSLEQTSSLLTSKQKQSEERFLSMISIVKNDLQFLYAENINMSDILEKSMARNEERWGKYNTLRGFTAENSHVMENLQGSNAVIFDSVKTNVGSRYNAATGIFISDVAGWYIFHFDIRVKYSDKICWTNLIKNGNIIILTYSMSGSDEHAHSAESNMAYIHLQVGDNVWINSQPNGGKQCSIDEFSTFAGFLHFAE